MAVKITPMHKNKQTKKPTTWNSSVSELAFSHQSWGLIGSSYRAQFLV